MVDMKELSYTQRSTRDVRSILQPIRFRDVHRLPPALDELERKLNDRNSNVIKVVEDICEVPDVFELVLSGLGKATGDKVVRSLTATFADSSITRYRTSFSRRLLERLGSYFSSFPALPDDQTQRQCRETSFRVSQLHHILDILGSEEVRGLSTTDEVIFEDLDLTPPENARETRNTLETILKALKCNFVYFLELIKDNRDVGEIIRSQYFQVETLDQSTSIDDEKRQGVMPAAFNIFSGKKTALFMNVVEGFGERRILMSSRTIRDLKKARSEPRLYHSILRTLRSLSGGDRDDLTEKLLATSNSVHVYGAKAIKGCAVVYCKDVTPSLQDEGMDDVVRVFGIFNASALENDFWQAFADQISCRRAEGVDLQGKHPPPTIHADKIRSLLVINKFVDLSQTVLEAIQNDEEVSQAFELSPQERRMLDHTGSCYVLGRSGTGKTTVMMMKMLATECTFQEYPDMMETKPRQLFVTRSQNLASKVNEVFEGMYNTHVLGLSSAGSTRSVQQLVDLDEEERSKRRRFGELRDDDFPLFLSYDHLCSLLEEELRFVCPSWKGHSRETQLSYAVFIRQYWPRLCSSAIHDPSLVYGQFIGVIEGSEDSLSSPQGYISRDKYVNMHRPKVITRTVDRDQVYDMYEKYRKIKLAHHQHDIADRTHSILDGLNNSPASLRGAIDFLFVDEAQDNLLIDTRLLRVLCSNPNGLFWAGDTAQTIFAGSAFTFNELKSFMWRTEQEILAKRVAAKEPQYFELTVNFRSAQGILACAQSLLDCISKSWPDAIDKLPKETGLPQGTRPLMFVEQDRENLLQLLVTNARGTVEFGAEQCIIVRDEAARTRALAATEGIVGDTTQILTLYQSKGLEYDDVSINANLVIIYNFFQDSQCELSQWRALLRCSTSTGPPTLQEDVGFDAIAVELKSLYVACTRAKQNLWLIDTSGKAEIVRRIWEKNGEIDWQDMPPDISCFASASSKSMWRHKAYEYFGRGYFDLARKAYRNAGLDYDASVASAYLRRENAELLTSSASQASEKEERSKAYREAAHAFDAVASGASGEYKISYYRIAAECFLQVPDDDCAAVAFQNALDYNQAIKLHRSVGNFEQTIQLLCEKKDALQPDSLLKVQYASQLFCLLHERTTDALAIFLDAREVIRFAFSHGLYHAEAAMVEHQGNPLKAAQRRLQMDEAVVALRLLRRFRSTGSSSIIAILKDLLSACWRSATIDALDWSEKSPQKMEDTESLRSMLTLAAAETHNVVQGGEQSVLRAILGEDLPSLRRLAFEQYGSGDFSALLCLSRIIAPPKEYKGKGDTQILQWLQDFLPMTRLLRRLCMQKDPFHSSSVQRVLGFRTVTPTIFRSLPGSAIEKHAITRKTPFMDVGEAVTRHGHLVSKDVLRSLLESSLSGSLGRRVLEAVSTLRPELQLKAGMKGKANSESLHTVVGCLLHIALILDQALKIVPSDALQKEQRRLVQDIYRVLTSPARNEGLHLSLGSVLDLGERDIQDGIQTILTWIRGTVLPTPDVLSSPGRVTDLMKAFLLVYALRDATRNSYCSPHTCTQGRSLYLSGDPELDNIQESVLDMFSGCKPWSPQPLLCLLSTVVVSRLPVNIEVLMSSIDFVAGWLALLYTQSIAGNVVGTVLSKRGLLVYGHGISAPNGVKSDLYMEYSRWLVIILAPILSELLNPRQGRDAFIYSKQAPLRSTAEDRHVYISRVCEAMVLLGHNIPVRDLREDILIAITSLQSKAKQFPKINKGYVGAKTWADLTAALPSALPLVALVQTSTFSSTGNRAYRAVRSALPLVERRISAMPSISKRPITIVQRRSALTSSTPAKVARNTPEFRVVQRLSNALNSEIDSQHRLFAAIRIQDFYRRTVSLRRPITYGNLAFLVNGAFAECISQVNRITWDDRRHRMVFLGIVPHVLACLDAMIMQFEYLKSVAVQRLKNCHHSKLEELGHAVTAIHDDIQATRVLRSDKLGPTAYVYRLHRWKEFRDCVREIPKLIEKLPANVTRDIRAEWSIVRKAVFQPGKKDLDWADARAGGMTGWPSANECKT